MAENTKLVDTEDNNTALEVNPPEASLEWENEDKKEPHPLSIQTLDQYENDPWAQPANENDVLTEHDTLVEGRKQTAPAAITTAAIVDQQQQEQTTIPTPTVTTPTITSITTTAATSPVSQDISAIKASIMRFFFTRKVKTYHLLNNRVFKMWMIKIQLMI
jgi:hypothetical protein